MAFNIKKIEIWLGIILATGFVGWFLNNQFGEWRNSAQATDNSVYISINDKKPNPKLTWYDVNPDKQVLEVAVTWSNMSSSDYKNFIEIKDWSWKIIMEYAYDWKITQDWKILIPLDELPKSIKSMKPTCKYIGEQRLSDRTAPECKIVGQELDIELPNYSNLNFLGVDATYDNDNIKLTAARELFESKWANFFSTYSVWKNPWEWALRIDNKKLFWKKLLFIFINEDSIKRDWQTYKSIIEDLKWLYPHLNEVMVRNFDDINYALDNYNEANDVRYILWYIWDCANTQTGPCDEGTSYWRKFSKKLLKKFNIDVFFIVPATMDTIRNSLSQ